MGKTKMGKKYFQKEQGETQHFKLSLGIEIDKNRNYQRQIRMDFFKDLKDTSPLDIYCAYHA